MSNKEWLIKIRREIVTYLRSNKNLRETVLPQEHLLEAQVEYWFNTCFGGTTFSSKPMELASCGYVVFLAFDMNGTKSQVYRYKKNVHLTYKDVGIIAWDEEEVEPIKLFSDIHVNDGTSLCRNIFETRKYIYSLLYNNNVITRLCGNSIVVIEDYFKSNEFKVLASKSITRGMEKAYRVQKDGNIYDVLVKRSRNGN